MTSTSYYDISDDSYEDFTPNRSRGVNHGDIQMVNSQINDVKSMVCDIIIESEPSFFLAAWGCQSFERCIHVQNMSCNAYETPSNCNKLFQYLA